jgi:hypothetical protein
MVPRRAALAGASCLPGGMAPGRVRGSIVAMDDRTAPPVLLLYSRAGCHLCEEAREVLEALLERRAAAGLPSPAITTVDIDTDPAAHDAYHDVIPVVAVGERRLELATSAAALGGFLSEALDGAPTAHPAGTPLR